MAGAVVLTNAEAQSRQKITLAWTSDASGDVSLTTGDFDFPGGFIDLVEFIPHATAPTAAYDVTVTDPDSNEHDVLEGKGANLSASATTFHTPLRSTYDKGWLPAGTYRLIVANAGNTKQGSVVLYINRG
jgi:hypothetical protein